MSTQDIPFQYKKENHPKLSQIQSCLLLWDFYCKGLKNEFEIALANEPSVFEPLQFCCILHVKRGLKCRLKQTGRYALQLYFE